MRRTKSVLELHRECGVLTVNQMIVWKVLVREIKVLSFKKPTNLYETLTNREDTHARTLRSNTRELKEPNIGRYHEKI